MHAVPWLDPIQTDPAIRTHLRVGPLELGFDRLATEWRVWWQSSGDTMDTSLSRDTAPIDGAPPAGTSVVRFAFQDAPPPLSLSPRLADRAVVCRPENSVVVPPRQRATLYVSTPVWVQVRAEGAALTEMPAFRPSDTWFGPNTQRGELCYASRTQARLHLADLPARPHRAVTAVVVDNASSDPLPIERLRLPVPALRLFRLSEGQLWTEGCTLRRESDDEFATLDVAAAPPPEAGSGAVEVAVARAPMRAGAVTRAFGRIASLIGGNE